MDGRRFLKLCVFLLSAAVGCQHQVMSVPNPPPLPANHPPPPSDPSQIKQSSAKPKELPSMVWVSFGDYKSGEGFAAANSPNRQQQFRDEARNHYQTAIKIDPKCIPAYLGLARLYTAMRNYDLAIETYQKALQIDAKNAPLWYELGMCHNYQRNWDPALECLSRANQLDPVNRSFLNARGIVLAEAGRYEDSLNCFVRSSGESLGYYRLALTLQRLQQPDLSRRYLEVALQKDPNLASMLAMRSQSIDSPKPANLPLQQTNYQDAGAPTPSAPTAPPVPAPAAPPPPAPAAPPAVMQVDATVSAPSAPPARQQIILPPPPPVSMPYDQ